MHVLKKKNLLTLVKIFSCGPLTKSNMDSVGRIINWRKVHETFYSMLSIIDGENKIEI